MHPTHSAPDAAPARVRTRTRARLGSVLAHRETGHLAKYGIVGVANAAIDIAVFAVLVHFGVWYVAARVLSVATATLNGYFFNRTWTFRAGAHQRGKLARYVTVQGVGLLINLGILTFCVEVLALPKVASAALAVPVVAAYCFLTNRLWTFGRYVAPLPSR